MTRPRTAPPSMASPASMRDGQLLVSSPRSDATHTTAQSLCTSCCMRIDAGAAKSCTTQTTTKAKKKKVGSDRPHRRTISLSARDAAPARPMRLTLFCSSAGVSPVASCVIGSLLGTVDRVLIEATVAKKGRLDCGHAELEVMPRDTRRCPTADVVAEVSPTSNSFARLASK